MGDRNTASGNHRLRPTPWRQMAVIDMPLEEITIRQFTLKEVDEILKKYPLEFPNKKKSPQIMEVKIGKSKYRAIRGGFLGLFTESLANAAITWIDRSTATNADFAMLSPSKKRQHRTSACVGNCLHILRVYQEALIRDGSASEDQFLEHRALKSETGEKRTRRSFKSRA